VTVNPPLSRAGIQAVVETADHSSQYLLSDTDGVMTNNYINETGSGLDNLGPSKTGIVRDSGDKSEIQRTPSIIVQGQENVLSNFYGFTFLFYHPEPFNTTELSLKMTMHSPRISDRQTMLGKQSLYRRLWIGAPM
jgi:hypothetical protein